MNADTRHLWSRDFLNFVAHRGYKFSGSTDPLSRLGGTDLKGLDSVRAGCKLINDKWPRLEDAFCVDNDDGTSSWHLTFGATWNIDKRIVGFKVHFVVDAPGWELVELFQAAKASHSQDLPEPTDPLVISQKEWESEMLSYKLLSWGYSMKELIDALRKGVSPFAKLGRPGAFIGTESKDPEIKAFMEGVRKAVGAGDGWHIRIAPLLTDSGIEAFQGKAAIAVSTPKATTNKKSLKDRTDIM